MARYIDAEALTDYMLERYNDLCEKHGDYDHYTTSYGDAIDVIEVAPTADVAPRAEVAREIFDEIEKYMMDSVDVTHTAYKTIGTSTFAILKKKYTEGGK